MTSKEIIEKAIASGKANVDFEKLKESMNKKIAEIKASVASRSTKNTQRTSQNEVQ